MHGVSVIVCCFNSSSRLRETLRHLALQKTNELLWEIILVDNASTDDTKKVAIQLWKEFGPLDVKLKVVDESEQGLSLARKKGIESSVYDVLIFCDDDNWLDEKYIRVANEVMQGDPMIGALGGTGNAVADSSLPDWFEQYKGCYACYPQGRYDGELKGIYSFLYGAGLVVRREAWQRLTVKKFTPVLPDRIGAKLTSGGDTELSYAIRLVGYKLWFSENLKFSHYLPASRLTKEYLYKLISAMSYCSGRLIIYSYVLCGKKMNHLVWVKDALYQLYFFTKSIWSYIFSTNSALEKKLEFAFSFNRMLSIFQQIGVYRSLYNKIWQLKSIKNHETVS